MSNGDGCREIRRTLLDEIDVLYRFILVRVGFDEVVAEDLLQQTAEVALRVDDPESIERIDGWLRGVARNQVRRYWRDTARRRGEPLESDAGQRVLAMLDAGCPREKLLERETLMTLATAIADLSAEDQRLLYAFYRHGRSQADIAMELGCTPKGVEMKLYRMRARLREALAACGDES